MVTNVYKTVNLSKDSYFELLCLLQSALHSENEKLKFYDARPGLDVAAAMVRERAEVLLTAVQELSA